jgi:hypothetical protein
LTKRQDIPRKKIILSEDAIAELDFKLQILLENISSLPELEVSFFKADELKTGRRISLPQRPSLQV